jgi:uncharacterized protein (TIGR03067 family)
MDVHCLVFLTAAGLVPLDLPPRPPDYFHVEPDRPLEGRWTAVSAYADGKPLARAKVHFSGPGAMDLVEGDMAIGAAYRLGRGRAYRTIDGMVLGKVGMLGIYRFRGNRLEMCFAVQGDRARPRPGSFSSTPGSGHVLLILERQPR